MSKIKSDDLLNEIAEDFCIYLKSSKLNFTSFAQKIDPNLNIDSIEKLLKIHFVLTENSENNDRCGVIDFIKKLSTRIRRIKTNVNKLKKLFRGEIRGQISWRQTISLRYSQDPSNKSLFICNDNKRDYNITENLVLKKVLQIINDIVFDYLDNYSGDVKGWIDKWFNKEGADKESLQEALKRIYHKNIYLKRIDSTEVQLTERMINRAKQSRHALYREAAELLQRYKSLMNYELDEAEAKDLLRNTFIEPEKGEVLFELYWIIRFVRKFKNEIGENNIRFSPLYPDKTEDNLVAQWKDEKDEEELSYKIYHNSIANFDFSEKIETVKKQLKKIRDETRVGNIDNFLGRFVWGYEKAFDLINKKTIWNGRPDIVLEIRDADEELVNLYLGEVKWTDKVETYNKGLLELLKYIALIKENQSYLKKYKKDDSNNNVGDNGILINGYILTCEIDDKEISEIKEKEIEKNIIISHLNPDTWNQS